MKKINRDLINQWTQELYTFDLPLLKNQLSIWYLLLSSTCRRSVVRFRLWRTSVVNVTRPLSNALQQVQRTMQSSSHTSYKTFTVFKWYVYTLLVTFPPSAHANEQTNVSRLEKRNETKKGKHAKSSSLGVGY